MSEIPAIRLRALRRLACATALPLVAALSSGCRTNPLGFPNEGGSYEDPDVVVPAWNGDPAPIPVQLPCPGRLVVYAADVEVVANCRNAGIAVARTLGNAAAKAAAYAQNSVTCKPDCTKQMQFIWVGWQCGGVNPTTATSAVEVLVTCVPPAPPKPGEVIP